jgi:Na+/H+ antiporter NhaC
MNTLFDFITHVKGAEYIIAVLSIGFFILFWELLKPNSFKTVTNAAKDDLNYIQEKGYGHTLKMAGKVAAAPFIGLAYVVMLPVAFFFALLYTAVGGVMSMVGKSATFEWRPVEAYFSGRKKRKKEKKMRSGSKEKPDVGKEGDK